RELREGARGLGDELLDHHALAMLLAFADARKRVQHVATAEERQGEEELPVAEAHDDELVRRGSRGEVDEDGELARREPVGQRAAGDRREPAGGGAGQAHSSEVRGTLALRRELEAEVAGRK